MGILEFICFTLQKRNRAERGRSFLKSRVCVSLEKCIVGRIPPNTSIFRQWGSSHLLCSIHHSQINKSNSSTKRRTGLKRPPPVLRMDVFSSDSLSRSSSHVFV